MSHRPLSPTWHLGSDPPDTDRWVLTVDEFHDFEIGCYQHGEWWVNPTPLFWCELPIAPTLFENTTPQGNQP